MSDENRFDLSKISVTDPEYAKGVFATITGVYNGLLNCKDFVRSNPDGKVKDYLGSMYDLLIAKGYNVDSPF